MGEKVFFSQYSIPSIPATNLSSIIGPTSKLHYTSLLVKGKIFHIHLAGAVVDGGRLPFHLPLRVQRRLRREGHLEIAVRTEKKKYIRYEKIYIY